jgi:hypothetical protein
MRSTTRRGCFWTRRTTCLSIGGLLYLCGYLTALWATLPLGTLPVPAQAAKSRKGHGSKTQHDHKTHEVDLAPSMIRNAYHFATLYYAARAERWELAAYQVGELEENLTQAARSGGPYAQSLTDFLKEQAQPLRKTITSQNAGQFRAAFQAAVDGCNDCQKATKHAFITIPQEPPALSIFVFPPVGR